VNFPIEAAISGGFAFIQADMQSKPIFILEDFEYGKDIIRTGIALWSEHTVYAFTVFAEFFCQGSKPKRRVDVVAQNSLSCIDVTGEEGVYRFYQQGTPICRVFFNPGGNGFPEMSR